MRISSCLALITCLCLGSAAKHHVRNHDTHDYFTLHLRPETSPQQVASALGLEFVDQTGELKDHYTFSALHSTEHQAEAILERVRERRRKRDVSAGTSLLDGILWSQKQKLKPRMEKRNIIPPNPNRASTPAASNVNARPVAVAAAVAMRDDLAQQLEIRDPIFGEQWHLFNTIQLGHDINVTGVWTQGITGQNATLVMVDDGIDMYSDDLKDNYFAAGSYDFNDKTDEPKPRLSDDRHGTRCAGEIAAVRNGVCGVGVAYDAKIGGIRILSKVITDEDEAVAMNYAFQENQIYSCSWGPPDDGRSMDAPGILIKKAMVNAIQNGRQGKGNIYVFAAGNGARSGDNCNFDGYTNSIYSVTVGAIDRKGLHPYYSEGCSAQLVVTYSSGSGDAIHTTDVGTNECSSNHGGTSAAAPLGAGIFGLALSVRPELTWRDLQSILVQTAVPINEQEVWDKTHIGKKFSHTYGYGKLDAYAVVEAAKSVELLKPQAWFNSPWLHVNHAIPQGIEGLLSTFEVTKEHLETANLEKLEHVTVTMNVAHTRRGDLSVELRSPAEVVSHLSVERRLDDAESGYEDWTFMSVAHWGEPGLGKWSIVVKDTNINEHNGTFTDWKLTLWGECIDASTQKLLPMPDEHDDDDHDVISAEASTATITTGTAETGFGANPTDHINRPVNAKPTTDTAPAADAKPTSVASATDSSAASQVATASPISSSADNFLPHYFPTFGVSKRTQIWIYGALAIIVLFCAGLGTYFYVQRRKRIRNSRDDYEFDVIDDEDASAGATGGRKGRRVKKRAGELYDAFAGESDEELLSDGESQYRDVEEEEDDDDDQKNRGRSRSREHDEKR
ncbi:pheromone processing endoprotease [Sticta canariensis]|nr:pheromone processing endoprotease [Sticta canariensis]